MQSSSFSRPRSGRTTRVAGMGAVAIGLAVLVTGSWLACSPGELDCGKVNPAAGCSHVIRADSEHEVLRLAGEHAVAHGMEPTPELVAQVRAFIEDA